MARRKTRALTEDEQVLWNKVIKQVETIETMPALTHPQTQKPVKPSKSDSFHEIKPFKLGMKAKTKQVKQSSPSFIDRPSQTSPNMDRRNFQRLLKGKLEIDGTLDLHGLTAEQARMHLQMYVQNAHRMHHRLLLVITGKGNTHSVDEFNRPKSGVLRSGVPEWLKTGSLSNLVLQVTQAHGKHGGDGAYYVYLRRKR